MRSINLVRRGLNPVGRPNRMAQSLNHSWRGQTGAGRCQERGRGDPETILAERPEGDSTMRLACVRLTTQWMILLALGATAMSALLLAAPLRSPAQATQASPPARITLLGTLSEWKYPGSIMLGGATMSDGGNPLVLDVLCQAILTTPDAFEKVAKFYSEKVGTPAAPGGQIAGTEAKEVDVKAVSTQDDSDGRPVALRVIVVNKDNTTTTLVISRANSEKETHIAWSHYRRFDR